MERGAVARRLIAEGEDPYRMLAAVVWPGRGWAEDVSRARLMTCPTCSADVACEDCGNTDLVTPARGKGLVGDVGVAYA
jgi:hypothetical protein